MRGERVWDHSLDAYLAYFDGWNGETRIGEASVYYLFSECAAQEIHDFNPAARIIIMLRNPVEMLYSMYYQKLFSGKEAQKTFEDALAAEPERKRQPPTGRLKRLYYRDIAAYTDQVERYFNVFGRDAVQVIIYDDFRRDSAAVYRETLRFLGVDETFEADFRVYNPNTRVRFQAMRDFFRHPPRWYLAILALVRRLLPVTWRDRGGRWIKSVNAIKTERPPMNPQTRRELQAWFRPEVARLSDLLGRDVRYWCE
jgi:hypothetical protein